MIIPSNCLEFDNRNQWHRWLEKHHAVATEAWLILYRKKYQDQGLSLDEAIEQALCFGWIDGQLKSLNEKCYALRFSPRTAKSIWSMSNIHRVEKLVASGKMTVAGKQKIAEAKANGEWVAAIRREQVDIIPEALEEALQKIDGAIATYRDLPTSRRKTYIYLLQNAKRAETKKKQDTEDTCRSSESMRELAAQPNINPILLSARKGAQLPASVIIKAASRANTQAGYAKRYGS